jgi:TP53 regulating kinase and related kinases
MYEEKLIAQGAEAKILLNEKINLITKERTKKSYRIQELDKTIRKKRTKAETKLLEKASKIIDAPLPRIPIKKNSSDFDKIKIPYVKGKKLSEYLNKVDLEKQKEICRKIGKSIALLHKKDIIHGDLTTSNMILSHEKIYFIDFGLGYISKKVEDKAVDLHLLKQALEAKHFQNHKILEQQVLKQYEKTLTYNQAKKIFERIRTIEKRGRYRH